MSENKSVFFKKVGNAIVSFLKNAPSAIAHFFMAIPGAFRRFGHEMKKNWQLYSMCIPAIVLLVLFAYIPMYGIGMAFVDYKLENGGIFRGGIGNSEFVGLHWIDYFFNNPTKMGWLSIKNTLIINFWGLIFGTVVPISLAICFNEVRGKSFKQITQSAMFFPYFLSWVVVGAIVEAFFGNDVGIVNNVLKSLGQTPIRWYANKQYWRPIIITADVWKWCGYNSIIYMAAMRGFDKSLYEAASVDGANKFAQIKHLTLPLLRPTVVVLVLMSIGRIFFGDYGMVLGIIRKNTAIYEKVTVIDLYVYNMMSSSLGNSYGTAIGFMQSVLGLILITISNKIAKKVNDGEGLF